MIESVTEKGLQIETSEEGITAKVFKENGDDKTLTIIWTQCWLLSDAVSPLFVMFFLMTLADHRPEKTLRL